MVQNVVIIDQNLLNRCAILEKDVTKPRKSLIFKIPQFLRFCPNIIINCAIFQFFSEFQFSFHTINPIAYCIEKFAICAEISCYQ